MTITKPIQDLDFHKNQKSIADALIQSKRSNSKVAKFKQSLNLIKHKQIYAIFWLFFFAATSLAQNPPTQNLQTLPAAFTPQKPTPSRFFAADLSMPDTFSTTNNLAKKVGSFYRAFGEIIFLQGTITDSFNVPIEGAIIEIWQTNSAGKYHTLLEPNSEYVDKYFNMSGRAISDNLGNYHFITIMPGSSAGRAPHINMNIYHPKFGKLETEMYFDSHPYNESDYQFLAYEEEERKMITAKVQNSEVLNPKSIKLCTFNITMKGVQQYKKF
jgi:protocatechuate 3,4-dioxygenase beta subunit